MVRQQTTSGDERWWEPRRPGEMTTEFLGRVLDELGADDLAKRARIGHFDDYFAPAEIADGMELMHLVVALKEWARDPRRNRPTRYLTRAVINAVKNGEFDGTKEESARWEASLDGQTALSDPRAVAAAEALLEKAKDPKVMADALRDVDRLVGDE